MTLPKTGKPGFVALLAENPVFDLTTGNAARHWAESFAAEVLRASAAWSWPFPERSTRLNQMVYFPGDDLLAATRPRGLPIGNLTSQFWANCYLNPFDHFVKRELRCCKRRGGYVRYVDDVVLFSDNRAQLWEWKEAIVRRLARLRLTIHEQRAQARPVDEGIPFLGFVVYPQRRRLKRRKGVAFERRLRQLAQGYADGRLTLDQVNASVRGWVNHVRYGNTVGLRTSLLGRVRLAAPPCGKI